MAAVSDQGDNRAPLPMLYYRAVRDLRPVWVLEDMRKSFCQGDEVGPRMYNPSEALLYAIVHDHQAYARYLLNRYNQVALAKPGQGFGHRRSFAPHLTMAVRYDRRFIQSLILKEMHREPVTPPDDVSTPLHLACDLLRPEAVLMLLGNGASLHAMDHNGRTPMDVFLVSFRASKEEVRGGAGRQCLDILLMFMPKVQFKLKGSLDQEAECWTQMLGQVTYRYLTGRDPAPLFLMAMQTILQHLSPLTFPDCLHELPIPASLKPPGLPGALRDRKDA